MTVICLYPERDNYYHLEINSIHEVTEEHYGGFDNKGQYLISGWWFSKICFITIEEWRDRQLKIILDDINL